MSLDWNVLHWVVVKYLLASSLWPISEAVNYAASRRALQRTY
jgi:hypothetical protein